MMNNGEVVNLAQHRQDVAARLLHRDLGMEKFEQGPSPPSIYAFPTPEAIFMGSMMVCGCFIFPAYCSYRAFYDIVLRNLR